MSVAITMTKSVGYPSSHATYDSAADLEEFITSHRSHGELTPEVGEQTPDGYLIEMACSCGVVFGRWVTPENAARWT
jgi:hypothetical protein